jgi:Co/Zn/Cd efflux system component
MFMGWGFAHPTMGVIGAMVILAWSVGLLRSTAGELIDVVSEPELRGRVLERLESATGARVEDLRVWPVGGGAHGCTVRLVSTGAHPAARYREIIEDVAVFAHVAVEVTPSPQGDRVSSTRLA